MESYRELSAWQKAYALGLAVYGITHKLPREEMFGLTSQLRRAALSVPSNIAEGYGRQGRADYVRFLGIARGSLLELETLLSFAHDLSYVDGPTAQQLLEMTTEVGKLLNRLSRSLSPSRA